MTKNYFALERNGKCLDNFVVFENLMEMSYEEMKNYDGIEGFVIAAMEGTASLGGTQLIINLIGPDDVFIWGIIVGIDGDNYKYVFVDWKKDGKNYRYEKN